MSVLSKGGPIGDGERGSQAESGDGIIPGEDIKGGQLGFVLLRERKGSSEMVDAIVEHDDRAAGRRAVDGRGALAVAGRKDVSVGDVGVELGKGHGGAGVVVNVVVENNVAGK